MGEESQMEKGILTINGVEYGSLLDITTITEDGDCINAPKLDGCRISKSFKMPKYLRCRSRKRFIKLLMGLHIQRDNAIKIANSFRETDSWRFKWLWFRLVAFYDSSGTRHSNSNGYYFWSYLWGGQRIMTVSGWIVFALFAAIICVFGYAIYDSTESALAFVGAAVAIGLLLGGMLWYFNGTASGKRALVDQRSDFSNGIERTIKVYTADGKIIAEYTGKIDIDDNDGGYLLFDFEGKRYTYYNCFIESIAEIE